jgi:hypothetical protein
MVLSSSVYYADGLMMASMDFIVALDLSFTREQCFY